MYVVKCALFRVQSNAHALPAQQYLEIKGLKLNANRKQAQRAGGIKFELAILHQSSTLSKLLNGTLNGTLDVASTLPYPELRTHLFEIQKK